MGTELFHTDRHKAKSRLAELRMCLNTETKQTSGCVRTRTGQQLAQLHVS